MHSSSTSPYSLGFHFPTTGGDSPVLSSISAYNTVPRFGGHPLTQLTSQVSMTSVSIVEYLTTGKTNPHLLSPPVASSSSPTKYSRRPPYGMARSNPYRKPLIMVCVFIAVVIGYRVWKNPGSEESRWAQGRAKGFAVVGDDGEVSWYSEANDPHARFQELGSDNAGDRYRRQPSHRIADDDISEESSWNSDNQAAVPERHRELIAEDDPYGESSQMEEGMKAVIASSGFDAEEISWAGSDGDVISIQARIEELTKRNKKLSLMALIHFLHRGMTLPKDFGLLDGETAEDDPFLRWERIWKKTGGTGMERALKRVKLSRSQTQKLKGEAVFEEGWKKNAASDTKLVVFSKTTCSPAQRALRTLRSFDVEPAPYVIDLDRRTDGDVLQSLLYSLTDRYTIPNIILNFENFGGADEVELLSAEGGLKRKLMAGGLQTYIPRDDGRRPKPLKGRSLPPQAAKKDKEAVGEDEEIDL